MARWKQVALVIVVGEIVWFLLAIFALPLSFGEMAVTGLILALVILFRAGMERGARSLGARARGRRLAREAERDGR